MLPSTISRSLFTTPTSRWTHVYFKPTPSLIFPLKTQFNRTATSVAYRNWKRKNGPGYYLDATQVIDYKKNEKVGTWWNPFSKQGREAFMYHFKRFAVYLIHSTHLRNEMNFRKREFLNHSKQHYLDVYSAFARGDEKALKSLVTIELLSKMKNQIAKRELQMNWSVKKLIKNPKLIHLIYIRDNDTSVPFNVAQIFVKFHTLQSIKILNAKGKVLTTKEMEVEEIAVFERVANRCLTPWRIMDFLNAEGKSHVLQTKMR